MENRWLVNVLVVVLIIAASVAGYFAFNRLFKPSIDQAADGTAYWKIYQSEELGFSFRYPEEWGDVNVKIEDGLSDAYASGKGKVTSIRFTTGPVSLAAYTPDFVGYAEIPYQGDRDLETLCKEPLVAKESTYIVGNQVHTGGSASYCDTATVNGEAIYTQLRIGYLPEGDGSFQLTQETLINLRGQTFKGLSVSQYFPEIASELNTGDAHTPKNYLEKVLAKQVPQSVLDKMNTFEQFVSTFRFQN